MSRPIGRLRDAAASPGKSKILKLLSFRWPLCEGRAALRSTGVAFRTKSPDIERGHRQSMSLSALSDESLLRFYDNVRRQVDADRDSMRRGYTHFFANGDRVKKYAAGLRAEMERRRSTFSPIRWL